MSRIDHPLESFKKLFRRLFKSCPLPAQKNFYFPPAGNDEKLSICEYNIKLEREGRKEKLKNCDVIMIFVPT